MLNKSERIDDVSEHLCCCRANLRVLNKNGSRAGMGIVSLAWGGVEKLLVCAILFLCLPGIVCTAEGSELVVPNGFDQLEGNSWMTTRMEDTGGRGFRQQLLISHHQFASVRGPIWITGFAARPDAQVTGSRQFTYFDVEWRISTTNRTPETMSTRFVENTGSDETLAFKGDWVLSTQGGQRLKGFDYVLELQTPFYYDPSEGDVLFDFICRGGFDGTPTVSPVMDGQWISERAHFSSISSPDPGRSFGEPVWEGWTVIQTFMYQPVRSDELKADVNCDQKADCADICFMVYNWHTNESFCDIAPEPFGDGIVDEKDITLLMEYIDVNSLIIDSEPNSTDETNGCYCDTVPEEATIVIPNGFDYLEGNSWQDTEVGDLYPSGAREQELISNKQFSSLGGPILITGTYYRPDVQVTTPREFTYPNMEIRLSTTQKTPETMSARFAENTGNDKTLVFSGDCTISTSGRDGLEDFDYEIRYQKPFYYDPSKGNLLAEYTCRGALSGTPTNSPVFDGQWISDNTHYGYVGSKNPDAETGTTSGDWSAIFRFSYRPVKCPDLKGDLNGDRNVNNADIFFLVKNWQTADAVCDIAPEPLGDGVVDARDLILLVNYRNASCPIAHWKLDETEGFVAQDTIGLKEAIVHGDAVWQPGDGNIGGALLFDGIDDYVSTPFILDPSKDSFSVFAWIKGGTPGQVVISQADSYEETPRITITHPGSIWLGTDSTNGGLMTGLMDPPFLPLVSETTFTDGQWHHIGLAYDMVTLKRHLFVDGIEVRQDSDYVGNTGSGAGLYIGAGPALEQTTFFSGLIDDVRIYSFPLSLEEIGALSQ